MKMPPRIRVIITLVAVVAFLAIALGQVYTLFQDWAVALFGLGMAAVALLAATGDGG